MNVKKFYSKSKIDLYQLAMLHKSSFDKSLATTLSTNKLSKFYKILFVDMNYECFYIENSEKEILGALILKNNNFKKVKPIKYLNITFILITGFFNNPIFWNKSVLKNKNLYKGLSYDYEISTIFVSSEHRSKNIGTKLINFLRDNEYKNIVVNTDIAENFYLKKGFYLIRVVNNISVFGIK